MPHIKQKNRRVKPNNIQRIVIKKKITVPSYELTHANHSFKSNSHTYIKRIVKTIKH